MIRRHRRIAAGNADTPSMGQQDRDLVCIEKLDVRRLLATYAAIDYFPIADNGNWKYRLNDDGISGNTERSCLVLGSLLQFQNRIEVPGNNRESNDSYIVTKATGVQRTFERFTESDLKVEITPETPPVIMPAKLSAGLVHEWTAQLDANVSDGENSA